MEIRFALLNFNQYDNYPILKRNATYPNLAPLQCDTVSFTAMKKKEFGNFDFAVVEKFKAPIEKFNDTEDFNNWAQEKAGQISENDYGGRQQETQIQRKAMLKEWADYVIHKNGNYTPAMQLVIMNAVTKDLKLDEDTIPPVLNKGVLADCVYELEESLKTDKKANFNFNKMYRNKLCAYYLEDTDTGETRTKWIKIPSKEHDPEHFEENVEKLKNLSHKNWCTKSFNAGPYLADGDFYVCLENGKPKIGIRFVGNKIAEIQGEKNNSKIPIAYFDKVNSYIKDNEFVLSYRAQKEVDSAKIIKPKVDKIKSDLSNAIANNDAEKIFEYFGMLEDKDNDENLILRYFKVPDSDFSFSDLGINEDKLFERVLIIDGDAYFGDSQMTNLGNLESIGGDADFRDSQITALGKLKNVGGDAYFGYSQITDLGKLKNVGGDAYFGYSQITNLGNLESIGGYANFKDSQITDLGKLKNVGGGAAFEDSQITNLGNLESIGGNAYFGDSQVTDLGNLESIGGNAYFGDSQVTDLGNLESIGGDAYFRDSQVTNLGNLESIGGDAVFNASKITNLGTLKHIGLQSYVFKSQKDIVEGLIPITRGKVISY